MSSFERIVQNHMLLLKCQWKVDRWHGDILAVSEERIFSVRGDSLTGGDTFLLRRRRPAAGGGAFLATRGGAFLPGEDFFGKGGAS